MQKAAGSRRLPLAYCFVILRPSSPRKRLERSGWPCGDFPRGCHAWTCTNHSHRPSKCRESLVLIIDIARGGGTWEARENELRGVQPMGKSSPRPVDIVTILPSLTPSPAIWWRACCGSGFGRSHNNTGDTAVLADSRNTGDQRGFQNKCRSRLRCFWATRMKMLFLHGLCQDVTA
jgi:hypothetical protein